ncbi:MAG TPA: diguanylate cyclase, partial [Candidatus Sabulitectum sp.]|nr:diguanylate cyclase [Candidatus Sabulitectum sp.]
AAMSRPPERVYDPVVVVDWSGDLVGTVTVKSLLERTIEAERTNSGALDPLTDLPGNVSVRRKLSEAIPLKAFNLLLTNINGFRAFNLVHGFQSGDRMILLLSELLKKHVGTYVRDAFIGQMNQDRFAVVSFTPVPGDCMDALCKEFDRRSASLFYSWEEQERGSMELVTRSGSRVTFPLCTVSMAATGNHNYQDEEVSPAMVLDCATTLLKKQFRDSAGERSGFLCDARIRRSKTPATDRSLQKQT